MQAAKKVTLVRRKYTAPVSPEIVRGGLFQVVNFSFPPLYSSPFPSFNLAYLEVDTLVVLDLSGNKVSLFDEYFIKEPKPTPGDFVAPITPSGYDDALLTRATDYGKDRTIYRLKAVDYKDGKVHTFLLEGSSGLRVSTKDFELLPLDVVSRHANRTITFPHDQEHPIPSPDPTPSPTPDQKDQKDQENKKPDPDLKPKIWQTFDELNDLVSKLEIQIGSGITDFEDTSRTQKLTIAQRDGEIKELKERVGSLTHSLSQETSSARSSRANFRDATAEIVRLGSVCDSYREDLHRVRAQLDHAKGGTALATFVSTVLTIVFVATVLIGANKIGKYSGQLERIRENPVEEMDPALQTRLVSDWAQLHRQVIVPESTYDQLVEVWESIEPRP